MVREARATLGAAPNDRAPHLALIAGARVQPLSLLVQPALGDARLDLSRLLLRVLEQLIEEGFPATGFEGETVRVLLEALPLVRVVSEIWAKHLTEKQLVIRGR